MKMRLKLFNYCCNGRKVICVFLHFYEYNFIDFADLLFPILDIVRLAVRHERICSILVTPEFLQKLIESCSHSAANQLMTTRCFVNMMNHTVGASMVQNRFLDIVRELCKIKQGSGNLQVNSSHCKMLRKSVQTRIFVTFRLRFHRFT